MRWGQSDAFEAFKTKVPSPQLSFCPDCPVQESASALYFQAGLILFILHQPNI
jgi:hypothetical protein